MLHLIVSIFNHILSLLFSIPVNYNFCNIKLYYIETCSILYYIRQIYVDEIWLRQMLLTKDILIK